MTAPATPRAHNSAATAPPRPLAAAIWMIGAIVSFSSMAVAGRVVAAELDTFETMMYRSAIGVLVVAGYLTLSRRWAQIDSRNLHLHAIRNLCHFAGQNLWFFAVTLIPLAQLFALEFTSPLWVLLLAPLVLGEPMTAIRAFSAALGFAGVLLVSRPGAAPIDAGVLAAAGSAICFAGSILFTKILTRSTSVACVIFWLTVMQLGLGLITAGADGDIALPSAALWPWLTLIGLAGLLAHLCLTMALSLAPATVVVPIDFARLPVIAIIGMLFYGEPLDGFVIAGALIIFAGNYLNIWSETRRRPPRPAPGADL